MRRHIVFVGLPGAGKSTVGALVSETLGARFVDIDVVIEARTGRSIREFFAEEGEPSFRALEREYVAAALSCQDPSVIAPGGGWASFADNVDVARLQAFIVYLAATPQAAAKRGGTSERPLLGRGDPTARLEALMREREPYYGKAHAIVQTEHRPAWAVAAEVVELARSQAGW